MTSEKHILNVQSFNQENSSDVKVIAVSKKVEALRVKEFAQEFGHIHFGENYLSEFKPKYEVLKNLGLTWHYLGQIQTKKLNQIVSHFDFIHSVSEEKHFLKINQLCDELKKSPGVFLQIKFGDEELKTGANPEEALQMIPFLMELDHLNFAGLMCILPLGLNKVQSEACFQKMQQLKFQFLKSFSKCELSMGMTADYGLAMSAGANWVRLGRALFGERD